MSKNFEEEYRQMIDSELPDLWDRIEAQLPKAATAMPVVSEETEASVSGTVKKEEAVTARRRRLFHSRWMPAVIAGAAALLFVIAALPVLFLPRGNKESDESPMMMCEPAEAGGTGDAMATADAADMYYDAENGYYDGIPLEETAAAAQQVEDSKSGDSDCAAEPPMMQDGSADYAPTNNASSVTEAERSEDEINSEETPDLHQVEVQILNCMVTEEGETFYETVVLQNGETGFQKGIRMYFRCAGEGEAQSDCADASFRRGEKYILSLYGSGETLESYGIEFKDGELYGEEMYIIYEIIKN